MRDPRLYWAASVVVMLSLVAVPDEAAAQVDLSGEWSGRSHEDGPHRGAGPELGDYSGLPLNEAGRLKAESWDASILSLRERQCIPHVVTYALRGPAQFRIWKETDPTTGQLVAYRMLGTYGRPRTIWVDGRPHPSQYAPHTWSGFSTGRWQDGMWMVTTTHIKSGWIQRNGAATTDRAVMTEYFIRHQDHLLGVTVIDDPTYLEEPFIRTSNFVLNLTGQPNDWGSCGPAVSEVAGHGPGYVPHYLPGENPYLASARKSQHLSDDGGSGGAGTTYPEYATKGRTAFSDNMPGRSERTGPTTDAPGRSERTGPTTDVPGRSERIGPTTNVPGPATTTAQNHVEVLPVQGNVVVLATAEGNVTVQTGDQGVLVIDAGPADLTDAVMAEIRKLSDKPIRFLLMTHYHPDHTGSNEAIAKVGVRLRTSGGGNTQGGVYAGPSIVAHENVLLAMSSPTGEKSPTPTAAWPSDTFFTDEHEVVFNGEAIQLFHEPAAHTDGDTVMFFRKSDVISTGDVFITTGYPVIDAKRGGSVSGVINALNKIIELTIPRDWQEAGTMVVPGHGRLADEADVVEYRDMVTIIHERVQAMVKKGMTLTQVKAARPTLDYDGRYGSNAGPWTTELFVEAVFRDVVGSKQ